MAREKTRFPGVYQRLSEARRHQGKPDVCFDITYKDGGRKVWEKVGWRSEGYTAVMASGIRAERVQGVRHGDTPAVAKREITLGEAWRLYEKRYLPQVASRSDDEGRWRNHLAPRFEHTPMVRIAPFHLERCKIELMEAGLAPQTVRHVLALLRRVYRKMVEWGLYSGRIPTTSVKMPVKDSRRTRWLTTEEADALLLEVGRHSKTLRDMCLLSLHTGLRAGEIFALRWEHVDVSGDVVNIMDPKSGRNRQAFLTSQAQEMLQAQTSSAPSALIFPARNGGVAKQVSDTFGRAVATLEMNKGISDNRGLVVFHTLRHTFGSWLAMAGVPLYTIAELMGHSSLEMTKRYSHLSPGHRREAVERLEAVISAGRLSEQGATPDTSVEISEDTGRHPHP